MRQTTAAAAAAQPYCAVLKRTFTGACRCRICVAAIAIVIPEITSWTSRASTMGRNTASAVLSPYRWSRSWNVRSVFSTAINNRTKPIHASGTPPSRGATDSDTPSAPASVAVSAAMKM